MQLRKLTILCLASFLSVLPGVVRAVPFVNTNSQITVGNFQISPTGGGTVIFSPDPQYLDVKVWSMTQNSLGEYVYSSGWQNDFVDLAANAAATWVNGEGQAIWSTATVFASSGVDFLPSQMGWGYGEGRGSLGQWFQITGGSGTTNTTISLDYSGSLSGSAGDNFYFRTELIAGLELWDAMGNQLIGKVNNYVLAGGPNETKSQTISNTTLIDTVTLSYDTWYLSFVQADSETRGQVPEPTPLLMMLPSLALLPRRYLHAFR